MLRHYNIYKKLDVGMKYKRNASAMAGYAGQVHRPSGKLSDESSSAAPGAVDAQFVVDTVAATMFRAANEPHIDILIYGRMSPSYFVNLVNNALAKDPERRYQMGREPKRRLGASTIDIAPLRRVNVNLSEQRWLI
jgi:hypothetical protein